MKLRALPEALLQQLWRNIHRLCLDLRTTRGEMVEVKSPGLLNGDAGPDFLNACVRIGPIEWHGDVEIHLRSSDWVRHRHDRDPAYETVILHVVAAHDHEILAANGQAIPTLVFPNIEGLIARYEELSTQAGDPACGETLAELPSIQLRGWLTRLTIERMQRQSEEIIAQTQACALQWEESFYRSLARSLGLQVNGPAMARLAELTPLKVLLKQRGKPTTIEGILLGQAGLLPPPGQEEAPEYAEVLRQEWHLHATKNGLHPMNPQEWRYMRLRPTSQPTLRVAQLAALVNSREHLFSHAIGPRSLEELESTFNISASSFWDTHYKLGPQSGRSVPKRIGRGRARLIILNTVLPFRFAYAVATGDEELQEATLNLLDELEPEDNRIVRRFVALGLRPLSAADTQALNELHKRYCIPRLCHLCPAGQRFLLETPYRTNLAGGDGPNRDAD